MLRVRDRSKLDLSFFGYNRLDLIARKHDQLDLLKDLNFKGMFFGIECKAGDNTPTALQLRELDRIQMHEGYIAIVNEKNLLQVEVMLDCIEAERNASQD